MITLLKANFIWKTNNRWQRFSLRLMPHLGEEKRLDQTKRKTLDQVDHWRHQEIASETFSKTREGVLSNRLSCKLSQLRNPEDCLTPLEYGYTPENSYLYINSHLNIYRNIVNHGQSIKDQRLMLGSKIYKNALSFTQVTCTYTVWRIDKQSILFPVN